MNKEERFEIELTQEEVQEIIYCYEKDMKLIEQLQQENKELHNKIDKAIETIESWHFALDWAENDRLKIIKEILKDSDVDENRQ